MKKFSEEKINAVLNENLKNTPPSFLTSLKYFFWVNSKTFLCLAGIAFLIAVLLTIFASLSLAINAALLIISVAFIFALIAFVDNFADDKIITAEALMLIDLIQKERQYFQETGKFSRGIVNDFNRMFALGKNDDKFEVVSLSENNQIIRIKTTKDKIIPHLEVEVTENSALILSQDLHPYTEKLLLEAGIKRLGIENWPIRRFSF